MKFVDSRLSAFHILFRSSGTQTDTANHFVLDYDWEAPTNNG